MRVSRAGTGHRGPFGIKILIFAVHGGPQLPQGRGDPVQGPVGVQASGAEVKIVTGVDDHSRFCVIAKAVMRATARPVCQAFVDAMRTYGIPEEVLTDNGKVFTGRFHKPGVPVEVLFDKICRENGITHRLTQIHSPTTTGKIERLHQTLQRELLDVHGPFESIEELQAALDAWRQQYNTDRPHQSLAMAFPASRFTPASSPLELRIPAQLTASTGQPKPPPAPGPPPAPSLPVDAVPPRGDAGDTGQPAVEVDRVVPASGNVWIGGQQVWLGPALSGRQITLWIDAVSLHVLLDGARIKTCPSGSEPSNCPGWPPTAPARQVPHRYPPAPGR